MQRFAAASEARGFDAGRFAEIALWTTAVVLALVALYLAQPILMKLAEPLLFQQQSLAVVVPTATRTVLPTATPTATLAPTDTPIATFTLEPTSAPLIIPTPPDDGTVLTLSPNPELSGWMTSSEPAPRWGDRLLLAGTLRNDSYSSVITFDFPNLAPGTEILYGALELTGHDAAQLGNSGVWQLELMDGAQVKNWSDASADAIASAPALAVVGNPFAARELGADRTNDFILNPQDLALLETQLDYGHVTFRLRAVGTEGDSLFVWNGDSGASNGLDVPTLYLVATLKPLIVITNTPYPTNVFTAAAQAIKATADARKYGTPTPFPRGYATASPAPGTVFVPPPPTAANAATRIAESSYATAVAITTGTFTPTPTNIIIAYPTATPVMIGIDQIVPPATLTPSANVNYFATPIPAYLVGKILVQSDRLGQAYKGLPLVMDENGKVLAVLSTNAYYDAAAARESFSPDRQRRVIVARDLNDVLQIWILDLKTNAMTQLTQVTRGIAYDPVWSPDGTRIAYVSTQTGITEIYVYDLTTQTAKQITHTAGPDFFNQRPSWSPDSQKLVFKSNRDDVTRFQIYQMLADGSQLRNLSLNQYNEIDPIWVKP